MPLTLIQQVRVEVADISIEFPFLDDATYQYFLDKNQNSIRRSALDAAKTILFQLSLRGDETVDIFSIKGSKSAEQYRLALGLFLKNPAMNPVLTSANPYASGISLVDMENNVSNLDNNYVKTPEYPDSYNNVDLNDPFSFN